MDDHERVAGPRAPRRRRPGRGPRRRGVGRSRARRCATTTCGPGRGRSSERSAPTTGSSSSSARGWPTTTARWSPCSTSPATARPSPSPSSAARGSTSTSPATPVRHRVGRSSATRPPVPCRSPRCRAALPSPGARRRRRTARPPPAARATDLRPSPTCGSCPTVSSGGSATPPGLLPAADAGSPIWSLLAVSGGEPVDAFGQVVSATSRLLAVWLDDRVMGLASTVDQLAHRCCDLRPRGQRQTRATARPGRPRPRRGQRNCSPPPLRQRRGRRRPHPRRYAAAGASDVVQAAAAEVRPPTTYRATQLLTLPPTQSPVLRQARDELVVEWLRLAEAAGRRVPWHLLPVLLDFAAGRRRVRHGPRRPARPARALAGRPQRGVVGPPRRRGRAAGRGRGRLGRGVADDVERGGRDGVRPRRGGPIRRVPASCSRRSGRRCRPGCRADAVRALGPGLSAADEPLLERALDDRAKSVREAAAAMLDRLPGQRARRPDGRPAAAAGAR